MLEKKYNHKIAEKKWQEFWQKNETYKFQDDKEKRETFVIDTPPPTVSGTLHMGHVFSYTQADFVARFMRMSGKDVFYPMGFDDNGLPTERLVEKVKKIRGNQMSRADFIKQCQSVVETAEIEFEALFNSIALSVDWSQKYQTISQDSQKLSQSSFVDLYQKGLIERKFAPIIWDCVDQTALSQADLVDKELPTKHNFLEFCDEDGHAIKIMTTRPELLPACVALMINSSHDEKGVKKWAKYLDKNKLDENGEGFTGYYAYSAVFGLKVPIICDNSVKTDKGTGAVMCCTFGDETDVEWFKKYQHKCDEDLSQKVIIEDYGKIFSEFNFLVANEENLGTIYSDFEKIPDKEQIKSITIKSKNPEKESITINAKDCQNLAKFYQIFNEVLAGKKIKTARQDFIKYLQENDHLYQDSIDTTHNVKCAERSGIEIEFITKTQWYIKILPFKEQLLKQIEKCNWHPEFMKVRALQWCENLDSNWCISRQRFFGVPIPAWKVEEETGELNEIIVADFDNLPIDPTNFSNQENRQKIEEILSKHNFENINFNEENGEIQATKQNENYTIKPETDILDTWATSSISPQLSSGLVNPKAQNASPSQKSRHEKLFPADLRPQAHEIIRSWAFYTIVKAYLHGLDENGKESNESQIPWKNLMISGWCLASDKTKMSKSKGNVVTPTSMIEEKGSDAVRYWASTSHLGADTAYSDQIFKIGQKLITKLFNAAKFASMNFDKIGENDGLEKVTQTSDIWILSRLKETIELATKNFEKFEYARAREAIEEFFWNDFCDNYLEIVKVRSYGVEAQKLEGKTLSSEEKQQIEQEQLSAIIALKHCLETIVKLLAPFTPHICEEIHSAIFAKNESDSINARGKWPKSDKLPFDENALKIGQEMLKIIAEVRKFKSDQNLSMKTEIAQLKVTSKIELGEIAQDLGNVCNAKEVVFSDGEFGVEIP